MRQIASGGRHQRVALSVALFAVTVACGSSDPYGSQTEGRPVFKARGGGSAGPARSGDAATSATLAPVRSVAQISPGYGLELH
jgi:hypothetical protein